MKNEFALAFNEVLEEKGLPKETILEALAQALVSAYRKSVNASNAQDIRASINLDQGEFAILVEKEVVDSVENDLTEVTLEVAREASPDAQLGDIVMVNSTPEDFGRVAAQQARQVIQQKIRDAENQAQVSYYEKQLGEIISGVVQATNAQGLTIALELNAEGSMPRKEMIPREHFRIHDRVHAVVAEIKESGRGPQIILSRTHRDFLRRLLENEVPEIFHGVVEIRSIAREPGQRAKVAVSATQQGIDPVGACVGMRGVRIQAIVRELHDEKIDVIEWNSDPTLFISKAISPARVNGVYLRETVDGQKNALVVVPEDQLSLAIGREGQNARLAAKLTGWRIDIKSLPESISDWLFNLQNNEELKDIVAEEKEAITKAEDIMARKAEGRVITTEEYDSLAAFNDRLERRSVRKQQEKYEKYQKIHKEAFDSIAQGAFEMGIEGTGLPLKIQDALREAGFDNAGKLVLTSKVNPDALLEISGIGPKTLEKITEFAEELPNLIPQVEEALPEEPFSTIPAAEEMPVAEESAAITESPEIAESALETEGITTEEAANEPVSDSAEEQPAVEKEMSFDEIFSLKPEVFEPAVADEDEEDEVEGSGEKPTTKKKKSKKAGQFRELEYDPDKDVTVAKKKHKRGDSGEWEDI
ncbi:MAG: transcription termination factor NusA [Pelolinea sp.]|nr:transcription termination factor NusA [Pelolinea sp.]